MDTTLTPRGPLGHTPADTTSAGIPRSLAPFFQEYDVDQLEPKEHSRLIIERTLAYGDRRELRWLFDRYGKGALREWVQASGAQAVGLVVDAAAVRAEAQVQAKKWHSASPPTLCTRTGQAVGE